MECARRTRDGQLGARRARAGGVNPNLGQHLEPQVGHLQPLPADGPGEGERPPPARGAQCLARHPPPSLIPRTLSSRGASNPRSFGNSTLSHPRLSPIANRPAGASAPVFVKVYDTADRGIQFGPLAAPRSRAGARRISCPSAAAASPRSSATQCSDWDTFSCLMRPRAERVPPLLPPVANNPSRKSAFEHSDPFSLRRGAQLG